ncbi:MULTISPECIES: hypothetical protein [Acinetobacter calcoaceticus/baumannii complex]|uniref:Nmad2 family putative nucleotide modification protein n=1 Tax=Acinetobacter calcoaceticus/baumannii complex TaxID=909768 RepID=UPI0004488474|nr:MULTISPECIES: hypothetical protein [Acinetobacter calcoaceticus/baumannii complex]EXA85504.1 hypothetical protein J527_3520 [Acinetobacter baumannii 1267820]MBP1488970.1 hypothetical protein [Acinetobacter nosocomialis]MDQ8998578.1 hypothetical protein [Acinetobacter baumannii]MDQ9001981.1 hypothetical protein [Acinetobacter baumannii]HEN9527992.1 hypothetical protein [Acinetobacter baumannii]
MKIFSYVVDRDIGFAPNPFFDFCTLATCKPDIRKFAEVEDWVIGTSSTTINKPRHIIFAMKVTEKMTFNEYWNDPRFANKKPFLFGSRKYQYGDNIYYQENEEWFQLPSHHTEEDGTLNLLNLKKDTKSEHVLISDHYYYFGNNCIPIPFELEQIIKKRRGHKYVNTELHQQLLNLLKEYTPGIHGTPLLWEFLSLKNKQLTLTF